MGSASYLHERLVASIIFYLKSIFKNNKDLSFLGSNIKIHVQGTFSPNNFNADVSVVQGQPEFMILPSGKTSIGTILNPVLVVEVTSESTIAFDFGDKLIAYKKSIYEKYGGFKSINQSKCCSNSALSVSFSRIIHRLKAVKPEALLRCPRI